MSFAGFDQVETLLTQPILMVAGSEAGSLWHATRAACRSPAVVAAPRAARSALTSARGDSAVLATVSTGQVTFVLRASLGKWLCNRPASYRSSCVPKVLQGAIKQ